MTKIYVPSRFVNAINRYQKTVGVGTAIMAQKYDSRKSYTDGHKGNFGA